MSSPTAAPRPVSTGKVIFAMTMSLDGFVNDERGGVDQLYPDLETLRESTLRREVVTNTGAVVMGWKSFAMAEDPDWYADNYEHQVPIFVVTRDAPARRPKETRELTFTFVTNGIESAILRAKHEARARNVRIVGGARSLQRCIRARLVNELHIDIMPVLLGRGLRLFEHLGPTVELTRTRVCELPAGRTHLEFRIGH
jgi:dihydrofolate reductase